MRRLGCALILAHLKPPSWLFGLGASLVLVTFGGLPGLPTQAQALALSYIFTSIDLPGADFTQSFGINDRGDIVGTFGDIAPPGETPLGVSGYLLSNGTFTAIDVPGGRKPPGTLAFGINNSGTVVGFFDFRARGFLQREVFDTFTFPGAAGTTINGINDRGDFVGVYEIDAPPGTSFAHAYVSR